MYRRVNANWEESTKLLPTGERHDFVFHLTRIQRSMSKPRPLQSNIVERERHLMNRITSGLRLEREQKHT